MPAGKEFYDDNKDNNSQRICQKMCVLSEQAFVGSVDRVPVNQT